MTGIDQQDRSRLETLAEAIAGQLDFLDHHHRLPPAVVDGLVQAGLWKLWVPQHLGGRERPVPESLALFREAARLDPVLGWSVAIGTGGGLFAAWLPEAVAETIYTPDEALIAGSGAPTGTARPVDGGYRVDGHWRYCSGAPHATWFTASVMVEAAEGEPAMRAVAMPAGDVVVEDSWDTAALQGTGSHDIRAEAVFVPGDRLFDLFAPPRIDHPLYRYPFMSIAEASFAAVALGCARGALDAFARGPARRRPMGGARRAADFDAVRERHARAEMALQAGECWLREATEGPWERVVAGEPVPAADQQRVALAAVNAVDAARLAVDSAAEAAGMGVAYRADPLGRFQRAVHLVGQHAMVSPLRAAELGGALLA